MLLLLLLLAMQITTLQTRSWRSASVCAEKGAAARSLWRRLKSELQLVICAS